MKIREGCCRAVHKKTGGFSGNYQMRKKREIVLYLEPVTHDSGQKAGAILWLCLFQFKGKFQKSVILFLLFCSLFDIFSPLSGPHQVQVPTMITPYQNFNGFFSGNRMDFLGNRTVF